jgi:hypothetical protein
MITPSADTGYGSVEPGTGPEIQNLRQQTMRPVLEPRSAHEAHGVIERWIYYSSSR